jgi:CheY-like chemotaxis protein
MYLVFPTDTVSSNQLLFDVAKHNFSTFVVKNYDLEQLSFGKMGLLVVKGFANYAELAHYRTVLDKDTELDLPPQVHEVLISEANFNLLLNEGRSFQEYFQYLEEQNVKNVEGQIPNNVEDDKTTEGGAKTKRSVKGKPQPAKTAKEAPKPQGKTVAPPATEEKTNTTPADTTKAENIKPATAPAKTEAKPNTTKTATKPTTTKPTTEVILWADDEIDLLKPHIMFLQKKGYEIVTVSNGRDALDAVESRNFDLIILDENMPGISGLETLSQIKISQPNVPVVMITKSEEENIMNQAIGSKIADYLIKPVNPNQILLSIKKNLHSATLVAEKA